MIQRLEKAINNKIKLAYAIKDDLNFGLQQTNKEFKGHFTLVVFPLLKWSKKTPEQTAKELGEIIKNNLEDVVDFNVVKGFLNLTLSDQFWLGLFLKISKIDNYGYAKKNSSGKTFMVEYASPNTNKPLHLGHLLNIFLGYSIARIYKSLGHKVIKTQIVNDRGIHICKSMVAWLNFGANTTPETANIKGDFFVGNYYVLFDKKYKIQVEELIQQGFSQEEAEQKAPLIKEAREMLQKWEAKDEKVMDLWKKMNGWVYLGFQSTYDLIAVDFDESDYESETYLIGRDVVLEGLQKKLFYQKEDASVWVNLSKQKMDDKLLLRGDGTSVYMTQDIGTAIKRYKNHPELSGIIYTVANEQNHHFKVLFAILNCLDYDWANSCFHLSYGMVELPDGKMKSREGNTVEADELINSIIEKVRKGTQDRETLALITVEERAKVYRTIALAGVKYFLLKADPKKGMVFDANESIDINGNTGPFIQYTYVRIISLINKVKEEQVFSDFSGIKVLDQEIQIIAQLSEFPKTIREAATQYKPSLVANYVYKLAKVYNNYYQSVSILRTDDKIQQAFRLQLSTQTAEVIRKALYLLGIDVVSRM